MTEKPNPRHSDVQTRLRRIGFALAVLAAAWFFLRPYAPHLPPPVPAAPPPPPPPPASWQPPAPPPPMPQAMPDMFPPPPPAPSMAAADERIARLEAQVETQRAMLEEIRHRMQANADAFAGLTIFYQLKESLMRGDPFRDSFNRLSAMAEENPDIERPLRQLAAYADSGVPSLDALKASFETAVAQAPSPDAPVTVSSALHSLIRIRKVGEAQTGAGDDALIARAEAKLARGEVGPALMEIKTLSSASAARFAGWVGQAEAHVLARKSLDALQRALQTIHEPL